MELVELRKKEYQEFMDANTPLIFHNSWWLEIFRNWYHHKYYVRYYGASKNDTILAVLPIPVHRKLFNIVSSPLLTPYQGHVFLSEIFKGKRTSIISKLKEISSLFAKALRSYRLVFYYPFSPWQVDLQPYIWAGFIVRVRYTYIIDLNASLEEIWKGMDKRRRNEIKKAKLVNSKIVEDSIDSFVELKDLTSKRQGKGYIPGNLWKLLFKECSKRGQCKVWTAYFNREPLASLFLVWDKEKAYYLGGGINENSQGLMSLLIWNTIKFSKENGLKVFDFEGSNIPRIEKYFRKFGGEIKPVFYVQSKLAVMVR